MLLGGRNVFRVLFTASEDVRRERLAARGSLSAVVGWGPDYVERIMRLGEPPARDVALTVNTTTGGPNEDEARGILARVRFFLDAGTGA